MYKKILSGRRGGKWKNKKPSPKLEKTLPGGVFCEYIVSGQNLVNLLNKLKKEEIEVQDVKFYKRNTLTLRVKIKDEQKFFAIIKNLCYNVKKVKNKGKLLFLYNLLLSPSIIVGAVAFIVLTIIFSGMIMGVSYTGNGARYSAEVSAYLESKGIVERTFFSAVDLEGLANDLLSSSDKFSFVSCKKKGNTLLINLILAENKTNLLSGKEKNLYSSDFGVVQEIKVYRGTALVSVGDFVNKGDMLVSGHMEIKEKRVEVNALAVVTLLAEQQFTYIAEDNAEEEAKAFALSSCPFEAEDVSVDKREKNGKYYYRVKVYYKRIIYTG